MKNNNRILLILKYLYDYTDSSNTVSIADINQYLYEYELDADRKTITECINQLIEIGYDIKCIRKSQNHYYINSRSFSLPEIKFLVDAVQSSKFISEEQSLELVDKLSKLMGEHRKEILKRRLYIDRRNKTDNREISEMLQKIHDAIDSNNKISFSYYFYNANKVKLLKHNGDRYVLSPHSMIWLNDRYYVIGYNEKRHLECKYRLDRMCSVEVIDEAATDKPSDYDVQNYFNQEFSMMSGDLCEVHLLCKNELMDSIIDKFGADAQTKVVDGEHFEVITPVKLSGTFFGWVFASEGNMKITAPEEAKNKFEIIIKQYCE